MKCLSSADFLSADDLPIVPVKLPDTYGKDACVYIRTLTAHERSELEKRFTKTRPEDEPGQFRSAVLVRSIVDEAGARMFTDKDSAALMGKSASVLETIFEAACERNGFRDKDVETLSKNST